MSRNGTQFVPRQRYGRNHTECGDDPTPHQDQSANGYASGVQVGASETREECGICDTVDYRFVLMTAGVVLYVLREPYRVGER